MSNRKFHRMRKGALLALPVADNYGVFAAEYLSYNW
jgi:hypothetical protein